MARGRACQRRVRHVCAPTLLLEPLRRPRGSGLAGSPRKPCPAGDRKLNCSPHAGTPLVAGLQDPNPALSEGHSGGEGPSWLLSPSPLPIAHVERWVDAALALLCCQIISGHGHRRTPQGVRRLRSGAVRGALLRGAAGGTAVPAAGRRDHSRCAGGARRLPGSLSPSIAGPAAAVAAPWVGCPLTPLSSPSSPPAASAVRHPALG